MKISTFLLSMFMCHSALNAELEKAFKRPLITALAAWGAQTLAVPEIVGKKHIEKIIPIIGIGYAFLQAGKGLQCFNSELKAGLGCWRNREYGFLFWHSFHAALQCSSGLLCGAIGAVLFDQHYGSGHMTRAVINALLGKD